MGASGATVDAGGNKAPKARTREERIASLFSLAGRLEAERDARADQGKRLVAESVQLDARAKALRAEGVKLLGPSGPRPCECEGKGSRPRAEVVPFAGTKLERDAPVADLRFGGRYAKAIAKLGVATIGELAGLTSSQVAEAHAAVHESPKFGRSLARMVQSRLAPHGLELAPESVSAAEPSPLPSPADVPSPVVPV